MQLIIVYSQSLNRTMSYDFFFHTKGFPYKNYGICFIFLLHEFIYLLLLVIIVYLILHKEII